MDTTAPAPAPLLESSEPRARRRCHGVGGFYIAGTVLAFFVFWPIGLAMLAWAIWREEIKASALFQKLNGPREARQSTMPNFMSRRRPSNTALAAYLEREQERLKSEQEKLNELVQAFEAFKDAERRSADEKDFEAFLRKQEDDQKPAAPAPMS